MLYNEKDLSHFMLKSFVLNRYYMENRDAGSDKRVRQENH